MNLKEQFSFIESSIPPQGLFDSKQWRMAVRPFPLSKKFVKELDNFGKVLVKYYQSISQLYRFSTSEREPRWVAEWLNKGKPKELIDLQLDKKFIHQFPRVIRPDILLTEEGWAISELDSVPGGIGLTSWLNKTYQAIGHDVIGSDSDMIENFLKIFPDSGGIHIIVSEEAKTYRPEMQYLANQLKLSPSISDRPIEVRDENFTNFPEGDSVYRFFEMFDLDNIPSAAHIFRAAKDGSIHLTPPPRVIMEEKMNMALLWNNNIEDFWLREMGRSYFEKLKNVIPRSWIVDPTPIPPHASIAGLDYTSWHQLKSLSQKKRDFILKISGFSELAWGARGVHLGSDMPSDEWSEAIDKAISSFESSPFILQKYKKPRTVETSWISPQTYEAIEMKSRVRLCPYYFVHGSQDRPQVKLSGVLATLCPSDKKIIHGMSDAVLAPCVIDD